MLISKQIIAPTLTIMDVEVSHLVYIARNFIDGGTRGAMGATASLNNHLKWLSPPMWTDRVLLMASACMVLLRA